MEFFVLYYPKNGRHTDRNFPAPKFKINFLLIFLFIYLFLKINRGIAEANKKTNQTGHYAFSFFSLSAGLV